MPVGAPAQRGQFVANLHHRRPNVIEELDLRHGLQAAHRHANGAAHNARFGDRRIEAASGAEATAGRAVTLNTPPLPFTSARFARGCSRPRPRRRREHRDCGAFPLESGVDQIDHGHRLAAEIAARWQRRGRGIDAVASQVRPGPCRRRGLVQQRLCVASCTSSSISCVMSCSAPRSSMPSSARKFGKRSRVAQTSAAARRMSCTGARRRRASANRAASRAHAPAPVLFFRGNRHRAPSWRDGRQQIGTVHFLPEQAGKAREQLRNAAARRLASTGTEMA